MSMSKIYNNTIIIFDMFLFNLNTRINIIYFINT